MLGIFKTTLEHAKFNRGGVSESELNFDKKGSKVGFGFLKFINPIAWC
jgi:hypothetical protein